jgi:hypothetical protein
MLKKNFDIDHHIAFSNKPVDEDNYACDELIVGWGVYNRAADPLVLPRTKWVYEQIYGQSSESDAFFDSLAGESSLMNTGIDWCTNLENEFPAVSSDATLASRSSSSVVESMQVLEMDRRQYTH